MRDDWNSIRADFPLLTEDVAYLDNAATAQKPTAVLDAVRDFYERQNANPLRGLYALGVEATDAYEGAREEVRAFIGAESTEEIIFTRNATESLNLVAYSWAEANLQEGDEILITVMEHHSNLLPWQHAARRCGAALKYIECAPDGTITEEMFRAALTERTKLVSMAHVSNVLGVENDIRTYAAIAHERGVVFVADGAQSAPHRPVDVKDLGVDFFAFSGHKMCAPMGIGVLYGKRELLKNMPPFLTGGEMIEIVRRDTATYAELPHKFEAGTVNAGGAVGLAAAIRYLRGIGFDAIMEREEQLARLGMELLAAIPQVRVLGKEDPAQHHGILTFDIEGVHPHDVAAILDVDGICVRAGHHCAQPLLQHLGIPSTTRASFAFYNTEEEVRRLAASVADIRKKMGY